MENKINIKKVAALNDSLRKTFTGGRVLLTIGFRSLPEDEQAEVLQKVRAFNDFTQDNDPYHEHDFGSVTSSRGTQVFGKLIYMILMTNSTHRNQMILLKQTV